MSTISIRPVVNEILLDTCVKWSLTPSRVDRPELSLIELAQRFGNLGDLQAMRDTYAWVERFQTCLGMAE